MNGWESFLVAVAGASAALAGLIFVSVSLNLSRILSNSFLPNRAGQALMLLVGILIFSSLLLVPGQSTALIGVELLIGGLILWAAVTTLDIGALRTTEAKYLQRVRGNLVLNQVTVLPYILAGISVLVWGVNGVYFIVPAILLSFVKAIVDSCVLLIEINR